MIQLYHKKWHCVVDVYDIRYDKNGFPHFLVYHKGKWVLVNGKHLIPICSTDEAEETCSSVKDLKVAPLLTVDGYGNYWLKYDDNTMTSWVRS